MKLSGNPLLLYRLKNRMMAIPLRTISIVLFIVAGVLTSCKNDIEYINSLSSVKDLPVQTGRNYEVYYTDSSKLQVIFYAPRVERYMKESEDGIYYEFPEGVEIQFFDKNEVLESILTANYATYLDEKSLGIARDSVVIRNVETDERLNTEELFWDRGKRIIYSNVFTKITNEDGIYYGDSGFESDQDFNNYKLIGSSGTVNVKDEELP